MVKFITFHFIAVIESLKKINTDCYKFVWRNVITFTNSLRQITDEIEWRFLDYLLQVSFEILNFIKFRRFAALKNLLSFFSAGKV